MYLSKADGALNAPSCPAGRAMYTGATAVRVGLHAMAIFRTEKRSAGNWVEKLSLDRHRIVQEPKLRSRLGFRQPSQLWYPFVQIDTNKRFHRYGLLLNWLAVHYHTRPLRDHPVYEIRLLSRSVFVSPIPFAGRPMVLISWFSNFISNTLTLKRRGNNHLLSSLVEQRKLSCGNCLFFPFLRLARYVISGSPSLFSLNRCAGLHQSPIRFKSWECSCKEALSRFR